MKCFFITACLVLFVVPSLASDRFTQLDLNKDKNLDWKEFSTAMPNLKKKAFDTIDADKNGVITVEEWRQFSSKHGNQKTSMQGMMGNKMQDGKKAMQQKMDSMMQNAKKGNCPRQNAEKGICPRQKGMPLVMPPKN